MSYATINCVSGAAITKGRYVKVTGIVDGIPEVEHADDGTVATADPVIGVAAETVGAAGVGLQVVPLDGSRITFLTAGGVLTPGTHTRLTTDANGKAVAATTDTDNFYALFIRSLKSTGVAADGDSIEAILTSGRA